MRLGDDTVRLIWSYHPEDPPTGVTSDDRAPLHYHGRLTRGARSVYLREKVKPGVRLTPDVKVRVSAASIAVVVAKGIATVLPTMH